ncbi:Hypothetical predicted protein [Octopus vulgaris]|uniref:Uncharacterized protein n=1 Tax=Octopus vulgaris TaxID=6645 RepID=A0AA36AZT0_OCTVU|nr:Hypothetical predicted protein [Octopus vulgaris]
MGIEALITSFFLGVRNRSEKGLRNTVLARIFVNKRLQKNFVVAPIDIGDGGHDGKESNCDEGGGISDIIVFKSGDRLGVAVVAVVDGGGSGYGVYVSIRGQSG